MSRLILKPALVLEGNDPATAYDIEYSSESGQLTIGCHMHPLREWKKRGREIIAETFNPCDCNACRVGRGSVKAMRGKLHQRLEKLIATIEQAESALKKSLRAQTKRT